MFIFIVVKVGSFSLIQMIKFYFLYLKVKNYVNMQIARWPLNFILCLLNICAYAAILKSNIHMAFS